MRIKPTKKRLYLFCLWLLSLILFFGFAFVFLPNYYTGRPLPFAHLPNGTFEISGHIIYANERCYGLPDSEDPVKEIVIDYSKTGAIKYSCWRNYEDQNQLELYRPDKYDLRIAKNYQNRDHCSLARVRIAKKISQYNARIYNFRIN